MIIALQTLFFFRHSLISVLEGLLRPYVEKWRLKLTGRADEDEDSEEEVFSEFDDERGVVFFPPMYAQRYAAVTDCFMDDRWCGKLEKVVDLGYHDMSFIKYLKDLPGVRNIIGVDLDIIPLRCSSDLLGNEEFTPKRETPLKVTLFQGNAADPDYRLIGTDAVVSIEMIEHMLPHDLERLVHNVFGFIRPWVAIFTTPNADFNVLFKNMEKNGLRRLDHMFEWTREQFHDWCSNIVTRYPQFTVTCKGIGPGPASTKHVGCCSQLAIFVQKNYVKQPELSLNSLAIVGNVPNPSNVLEEIDTWDVPQGKDSLVILSPNNRNSFGELTYTTQEPSSITLYMTTPDMSVQSLQYCDSTSQCNLDTEVGKNYLMFNEEEMCFKVIIPRRKYYEFKVYEIEDVNSRLNCTTYQVTKFSKKTQNLMSRNKIDSLVHTREVVDEIRHLTAMLNLNKNNEESEKNVHSFTYRNYNWGEFAPYWNQYYSVVREYNYPFEPKSDECRILDLVSEEINRLVDSHTSDGAVFEIPLKHIMHVVQHITNDIEVVKDMLEWNGYEISGDVIVHFSAVGNELTMSIDDDDWQDNDTIFSDWDAMEIRSNSVSDGSAVAVRALRHALDNKVRKLKNMVSDNKDFTTELDKVVCRLMKLALKTSKGLQAAPSARWMESKLLDLLTLTEKAVLKRQMIYVEKTPKAIGFDNYDSENILQLKQNDQGTKIVEKYGDWLEENMGNYGSMTLLDNVLEDLDDEKKTALDLCRIKVSSCPEESCPTILEESTNNTNHVITKSDSNTTNLVRDASVEDFAVVTSVDNNEDYRTLNDSRSVMSEPECSSDYSSTSNKTSQNRAENDETGPKNVEEKTKIVRKKSISNAKLMRKNSSQIFNKCYKKLTQEYAKYATRSKRKIKEHQILQSTVSKPIPGSLIELCHPELLASKNMDQLIYPIKNDLVGNDNLINSVLFKPPYTLATNESVPIDTMDDMEQSTSLYRSVGMDAEIDPMTSEHEIIGTNLTKDDSKVTIATENIQSETIFLYDLNEPTTSKGVRHTSMDVQCGTDTISTAFAMLSPVASHTKSAHIFKHGIKIGDSLPNVIGTSTDFHFINSHDIQAKTTDGTTSTHNKNSVNCSKVLTKELFSQIESKKRNDCDTSAVGTDVIVSSFKNCAVGTDTYDIGSNYLWHNVEVEESFIEAKEIKQFSDACTSNDIDLKNDKILCPRVRNCGIVIKDSNTVLCKKENDDSLVLSTIYKEDTSASSSSNYYAIKQINECQKKMPENTSLSCCGVHVLCFKEKVISEDIIYQGHWQSNKPRTYGRKKIVNTSSKAMEVTVKKTWLTPKKAIELKTQHFEQKKTLYLQRRSRPLKTPLSIHSKQKGETQAKNTVPLKKVHIKKVRSNKSIHTISSNIRLNTNTSKNNKNDLNLKKNAIISQSLNSGECNQLKRNDMNKHTPVSLKNRKFKADKSGLHCIKTVIQANKYQKSKNASFSDAGEITKDLIKFNLPSKNTTYTVFRNELDSTKMSSSSCVPLDIARENVIGRNNTNKSSPKSLNSSSCSSLDSIATVREQANRNKQSSRKQCAVSRKSSFGTTDSEPPTPGKNKKYSKKSKSNKNTDEKDMINASVINLDHNKENIPETSETLNREKESVIPYESRSKNVYMAQFANESLPTLKSISKHKSVTKSNVKIPIIDSNHDRKNTISTSSLNKKSTKSIVSCNEKKILESTSDSLYLPMTVENRFKNDECNVTETQRLRHRSQSEAELVNFEEFSRNILKINENVMRQILEETIDFVANTKVELEDDRDITDFCDDSSVASFKTVTLNYMDPSYTYLSADDEGPPTPIRDGQNTMSFETLSKESEYVLADNTLIIQDAGVSTQVTPVPSSSSHKRCWVRDIFGPKNKDPLPINNARDAPDVQAFSGVSMNAGPQVGDQPDYVNLIDSETGSFSLDYCARQAASEELFVSGRSSTSYETVEDDNVVPNWLFQYREETEDDPSEGQMALSFVQPSFDENGNATEPGVGFGAGAGDGRGMHSDHSSHDSSGRGTSLTSTETSSEQQSEAMSEVLLIDPAAFVVPSERLYEPISNSNAVTSLVMPAGSPEQPHGYIESNCVGALGTSRGDNFRPELNAHLITSDIDGDISSLDTDVPDSS